MYHAWKIFVKFINKTNGTLFILSHLFNIEKKLQQNIKYKRSKYDGDQDARFHQIQTRVLSKADGLPPRCTCPNIVVRVSYFRRLEINYKQQPNTGIQWAQNCLYNVYNVSVTS